MEYVRLFNDLTITAVNTLNMFVLSLRSVIFFRIKNLVYVLFFRNMCYFCIVIYQTYRVIDLLINNNRMSSAIAQILSEKQRTSRLRKLFLASI
jgi:uncharacterized membrane-anchored protein YitT (DUF2179 family)